MTTAGLTTGRRVRRGMVAAGVLVVTLLAGWFAVHTAMPAWYARLWHPLAHESAIRAEAAANGLDPALVAAVIYRESGFSSTATSTRGAVGLMQVLPDTARFIATQPGAPAAPPERLAEPRVNIAYGAWYLHYLTTRYASEELALAAYNGGETNLLRWIADARADGRELQVEDVPFPETRRFVRDVKSSQAIYRRAYAAELGSR